MKFLSVLLLSSCLLVSLLAEAQQKDQQPVLSVAEIETNGNALTASISKKVDALLPDAEHPLFAEHLRALRSLCLIEWGGVLLDIEGQRKAAEAYLKYATIINDSFDGDAAEWKTYKEGRRPLIRGYIADHDRLFSYYTIRLPANWDETKTYPGVFYLHGYTPQPYMSWMVHYALRGKEAPANKGAYYNVAIWGRGNTSYRYAGEVDLDHAVLDFQTTFKHDENRLALCGHSMGSFGSWAYAIDRPDLWSAVGLYSGADALAPVGSGFAQNVAHLPIHIWHGAKDMSVVPEFVDRFKAALMRYGNTPSVTIDPEGGHMVSRNAKGPNRQWLLQHERKRPNPITFKVATQRYPGAWGIAVRVDPAIDAHPSFTCKVDGQTVWLSTSGTTGVKINLGAKTAAELEAEAKQKFRGRPLYKRVDLGLSGDVVVYWNGIKAYEGPVKELSLGDGVDKVWHKLRNEKRAQMEAEQAKYIQEHYIKVEAPEAFKANAGGNLNLRFDDADSAMVLKSLSRNSGLYLYMNKSITVPDRMTVSFNADNWAAVMKQLAEHLKLKVKVTKDSAFFDR